MPGTNRPGVMCTLWFKDQGNTRFEVFDSDSDATRFVDDLVGKIEVLGLQYADGATVDAANMPAPPQRPVIQRNPNEAIFIEDPFTKARVKAVSVPPGAKKVEGR